MSDPNKCWYLRWHFRLNTEITICLFVCFHIIIQLQVFHIQTVFPGWDLRYHFFPKHFVSWLYLVLFQEELPAWNNLGFSTRWDFGFLGQESLYIEADWDIAVLWWTVCLLCRVLVKWAQGTRDTRTMRHKQCEVFWAILSSAQRVCPGFSSYSFQCQK